MTLIADLIHYLNYPVSVFGLSAVPAYYFGLGAITLVVTSEGSRQLTVLNARIKEGKIVRPEVEAEEQYKLTHIQWELGWTHGLMPAFQIKFLSKGRDVRDDKLIVYRPIDELPDGARLSQFREAVRAAYSNDIDNLKVIVTRFGLRKSENGNNLLRTLRVESTRLLRRHPELARPRRLHPSRLAA